MLSAREHGARGIGLCRDPSAGSPGVINKLNRLVSDHSRNLLRGVIRAKNHSMAKSTEYLQRFSPAVRGV